MLSWLAGIFKEKDPISDEVRDSLMREAVLILDRVSALEIMYSEASPSADIEARLRRLLQTYQGEVAAHRAQERKNSFRTLQSDIEDRLEMLRKIGPGGGLRVVSGESRASASS